MTEPVTRKGGAATPLRERAVNRLDLGPGSVTPCTECGKVSELLLPPRFPHICSRCLFPPYQADPRELVQALTSRVRKGSHVAS